ncbi:ATP-binding protein [Streptomyces sp. ASQP_92]|uniref:ATP-binding protein n=1 Tax=unclassified Streptomyces TaxID=2593676 RepID=UPI0021C1228D|nr:ATP-binding protein [Streptomyces sp. ASQP_92]MCT9089466.1 ATP-binding protein [Streptomyces sp. ASQP_92]
MKQSTKTLGVVALGAAFAAAAAGTASAAPALPALGALSTVTAGTPIGAVSKVVPAASPEALVGQQEKKTSGDPVGSLLGGLPTGPVASNLASGGLPGGLGG